MCRQWPGRDRPSRLSDWVSGRRRSCTPERPGSASGAYTNDAEKSGGPPERGALVEREATPDAVALARRDRLLEAPRPDRAGGADRLGALLACQPLTLALAAEGWIEIATGLTTAERRVVPIGVEVRDDMGRHAGH